MMLYQTFFSCGKSEGLHKKDEFYNVCCCISGQTVLTSQRIWQTLIGAYVVQVLKLSLLVLNLNVLVRIGYVLSTMSGWLLICTSHKN